jgi:8-oxo-dGTP pyrophosphatase MutT (NUDIX family)
LRKLTNHAFMEIVLQALIANEHGEILMLRRPEGKWQFVGGRVNQGEHWLEGLRREVREETGIVEFEIVSVMSVDNWVWQGVPQFGVYLYCRTSNASIVLSDEHTEYRWISHETDLSEFEFFHPSLLTLLKRALKGETVFQML